MKTVQSVNKICFAEFFLQFRKNGLSFSSNEVKKSEKRKSAFTLFAFSVEIYQDKFN
jgi:hypothetical protein